MRISEQYAREVGNRLSKPCRDGKMVVDNRTVRI